MNPVFPFVCVPSHDEILDMITSLRQFECWPDGVDPNAERPAVILAASCRDAATKFVRRCLEGGACDHGLISDILVRQSGTDGKPDLYRVVVEVTPKFHTSLVRS